MKKSKSGPKQAKAAKRIGSGPRRRASSGRVILLYDPIRDDEKNACAFPHKDPRSGFGRTMGFS